MLDIVGIGPLNLDLTITNDMMSRLSPALMKRIKQKVEIGTEYLVEKKAIQKLVDTLGPNFFQSTLGGSAFNTIHAMASISSGIHTGYVGIAGSTGHNHLDFVKVMRELAIDHVYVDNRENDVSGLCVSLNQHGSRSFLYHPGCNVALADFIHQNYGVILSYLSKSRLVHVTGFTDTRTTEMVAKIIQEAKRKNPAIQISCDPGFSWTKWLASPVRDLLPCVDLLFLNQKELELLAAIGLDSTIAEKIGQVYSTFKMEKTLIVIKNNEEIQVHSRWEEGVVGKRFPIDILHEDQVLDSTGAGDIFAAGFLTVWLMEGKKIRQAVDLGLQFLRAKLYLTPDIVYPKIAVIFQKYKGYGRI